MSDQERWRLRWGLLTELVHQAPCKLGRTAVMKLVYFLQTLKGVPLEYDFRFYTYGPFDSDVLNDLWRVESLGAVKSRMVTFSSGYGYEFSPGPKREVIRKPAGEEHLAFQDSIRWVLHEFGQKSAADLELLSTIIYADREAAQQHKAISFAELARRVKEVKPRFAESYILQNIKELDGKGLLETNKD